jgi:hypothetical protein
MAKRLKNELQEIVMNLRGHKEAKNGIELGCFK